MFSMLLAWTPVSSNVDVYKRQVQGSAVVNIKCVAHKAVETHLDGFHQGTVLPDSCVAAVHGPVAPSMCAGIRPVKDIAHDAVSYTHLEETLKMITVLMASYNGSRYIRQQLDSILAQDEEDVRILVSDDCSSDGSRELLKEYEASRGDRVLVLLRKEPSGGAAVHFLKLLKLMADAAHGPEELPQPCLLYTSRCV